LAGRSEPGFARERHPRARPSNSGRATGRIVAVRRGAARMTGEQLRADLRRALEAAYPADEADRMMREIERRIPGQFEKRRPDGLLADIGLAVAECFPDR